MTDLTAYLHSYGQIVETWAGSVRRSRRHLGLSECGHECERYLWYAHHGYAGSDPDGRMLRLFQLGNLIEDQAYLDLMGAGFNIHSRQRVVSVTDGEIRLEGHIDGIIEGLLESKQPHLWECKSANDKSFQALKKAGYEAWNPKYKAQIHVYMTLANLERCLVWVENKNDSTVHAERIKVNRKFAVKTLERCFNAIRMTDPPERLCPGMSYYKAKWCKFYEECFKTERNAT